MLWAVSVLYWANDKEQALIMRETLIHLPWQNHSTAVNLLYLSNSSDIHIQNDKDIEAGIICSFVCRDALKFAVGFTAHCPLGSCLKPENLNLAILVVPEGSWHKSSEQHGLLGRGTD